MENRMKLKISSGKAFLISIGPAQTALQQNIQIHHQINSTYYIQQGNVDGGRS